MNLCISKIAEEEIETLLELLREKAACLYELSLEKQDEEPKKRIHRL